MYDIVILGGGTGGTLAANRLRRMVSVERARITVIDQNDDHVYQPGLLFIPFGLKKPADLVRSRRAQLHDGIDFIESEIDAVEIDENLVYVADGHPIPYDVLIVATGVHLLPQETEGMLGQGWNKNVFTFYNLDGATALAGALRKFAGGRIALNIVDLPIKCPIAPLEFAFLADWYFTEHEIRQRVDFTYVTPLDGAFTKPVASTKLGDMLLRKGIELVTGFNTGEIDSEGGRLVSYDQRTVPFDVAVVIPVNGGADYIGRSESLGDSLNFIPTNEATLQHKTTPNIFAIGDATSVPTSKAGSVAHFEGQVLCENVMRFLSGKNLDETFDGHANCFVETGFGKALLIDFNYDTQPLPGHFPMELGLPLLKESRTNHLAKLLFEWVYWHNLLPGRDLPGIRSAMPDRGKIRTAEAALSNYRRI